MSANSVPNEAARRETFEGLLTPLLPAAYRLAANLVGDPTDAEDVVQEAALLAFRGFHQFQAGTNFRAWFFRIVTNCSYGRHRQRKRRPETVDLDDVPDLYMYQQMGGLGPSTSGPDPAGQVIGQMTVEQVMAAIEALPDEYRVAASLYFTQDLSYDEIAQVLECPVGTVRSRLHRGRKLLQQALWAVATESGIVRPPAAGATA